MKVRTVSVLYIPSRKNLSRVRISRLRKCWWMCMTSWTSRRMPMNCSAKSVIAPIKRPSSGWAS